MSVCTVCLPLISTPAGSSSESKLCLPPRSFFAVVAVRFAEARVVLVEPAPDADKRDCMIKLWNACWSALHTVQTVCELSTVSRSVTFFFFPPYFFDLTLLNEKHSLQEVADGLRGADWTRLVTDG